MTGNYAAVPGTGRCQRYQIFMSQIAFRQIHDPKGHAKCTMVHCITYIGNSLLPFFLRERSCFISHGSSCTGTGSYEKSYIDRQSLLLQQIHIFGKKMYRMLIRHRTQTRFDIVKLCLFRPIAVRERCQSAVARYSSRNTLCDLNLSEGRVIIRSQIMVTVNINESGTKHHAFRIDDILTGITGRTAKDTNDLAFFDLQTAKKRLVAGSVHDHCVDNLVDHSDFFSSESADLTVSMITASSSRRAGLMRSRISGTISNAFVTVS